MRWLEKWSDKHKVQVTIGDQINQTHCWEKRFNVACESMQDGTPFMKGDITIYTDGSKTGGHLGFGFYVDDGTPEGIKESGGLGTQVTVFQSEIYAISAATNRLQEVAGKDVVIYSDSQAALLALDSPVTDSRMVFYAKQMLNSACTQWGKNITLRWVKAHVGHPGNEIADQLAKNGSMDHEATADEQTTPPSYWKAEIKRAIETTWSQRFQKLTECRQTKIWFGQVDKNKSKHLLKLNRHELGEAIQVITGHAHLRYHDSKIDRTVSSRCRLCQEEDETSWHLVALCPGLGRKRLEIFETPSSDEIQAHWTVPQLTRFIRATIGEFMRPGVDQTV
jgi:ribonuclease HI